MGQKYSEAGISVNIDLETAAEDIRKSAEEEMAKGAESIAEKSREKVPVRTGALKENCKVVIGDSTAEVLYDLPYAIEQHEDMNKSHSKGRAKYLEDAFNEECNDIVQKAAEAMRRATQ